GAPRFGIGGNGGGEGTTTLGSHPRGGAVPRPQAEVKAENRLRPELGALSFPESARVRPHWSATTWTPLSDWKLTSHGSPPRNTFPWTMLSAVSPGAVARG